MAYIFRIVQLYNGKQYTSLWCIVFSLVIMFVSTFSIHAFADVTVLRLNVIYGISGNVTIVGPTGIVVQGSDIYFSGSLIADIVTTSIADTTIVSSEGNIIYQGPTDMLATQISTVVTGQDRSLMWTGIAFGVNDMWYEYTPVYLIKDATAPSHPGTLVYEGNHVAENFQITWSTATETGVGGLTYNYQMLGVNGPASGFFLNLSTTNTSLLFGPGVFFPGEYEILISARDALYNTSYYLPTTLTVGDVPTSGVTLGASAGTGGIAFSDICLCGDYSGSPYDYLCSSSYLDESNYVSQYCSTIYSDGSGGSLPVEFLEQWSVITDRLLDVVNNLPSVFNTVLQLPNSQLIIGDGHQAYRNKLHIIMQRATSGDYIGFDRPLIQGSLEDGILYITYIDNPIEQNILCLNCCSTVNSVLWYVGPSKFLWYVWWCHPLWLLLLFILLFLIGLLIDSIKRKFSPVKTLKDEKKVIKNLT